MNNPPNLMLKFFRWFCHPDLVKYIEGDLIELFEERTKAKGVRKAKWLFAWDVLKLFRPGIIRPAGGTYRMNGYGIIEHSLKIGWRNIVRSKSQTIINVVGLSIAAAVCLTTFIFYQYETTFDHHHVLSNKTFRVVQHTTRKDQELFWNTTAYPLAASLRNDFPDFLKVCQAAGPMKRMFSVERRNGQKVMFEEDHVLFVDSQYPQVFDFEWIVGDHHSAFDLIYSAVITERIAEKCFGEQFDPSKVIGQSLLLNNKDPLIIRGIIRNPSPNTNLKSNILVSYEFFKKHNPYPTGNWSGNYRGTTFVVLNDNSKKTEIETKINSWKSKYLSAEDDQQIDYFLQPIQEIHTETLYGVIPQGYQISKGVLKAMIAVALFILVIAIVNFINLVTAQAYTRSRDVGIRKVIGGSRNNLLGQFLIENSLVIVIALILSIGFSFFFLGQLNRFLGIIDMQLSIDFELGIKVMILCFVFILLSTLYPAMVLTSFKPTNALARKHFSFGRSGFRKGLILFQFTIVQVFVISAIIVGNQLRFIENKQKGFTSEKIVVSPIPDSQQSEIFRSALLNNNLMAEVATGSGPPMAVEDYRLGTTYRLPQENASQGMEAEMKIGDPEYLGLFDLHLIAGRNFRELKPYFDEFIINRKLARSLNWSPEEAIGKKLEINEGEATVVGVVEDFHNHSLQHEFTPVVFMNWSAFQQEAFIKVRSYEALTHLEDVWESHFPSRVFSYRFLDDAIAREYIVEQLIFTAFKVLSVLVIIIGCLGLIGLISFMTVQKTKEIGIRKVLGAALHQILMLFTRDLTILILAGFIAAVPIVWYFMNQWLQTFHYRIGLKSWEFLLGGIITLLIGIVVVVARSLKCATANPIDSLRNE